MIDPGKFLAAKFLVQELGRLEGVLYTHQHADHFDPQLVAQFKSEDIRLYGNKAVAELIGAEAVVLEDGRAVEVGGFNVLPHNLPHCLLADGSDGPLNTGYIIDGHFFHPGDGIETKGVKADHLALPIAGPSISFYNASRFAKGVGAKKIIPIHFDNVDLFPGNPNGFAKVYSEAEVIVLADGESVEL